MTGSVRVRAFQRGGNLVLTDKRTIDDAQASGRWIRYDPEGQHG